MQNIRLFDKVGFQIAHSLSVGDTESYLIGFQAYEELLKISVGHISEDEADREELRKKQSIYVRAYNQGIQRFVGRKRKPEYRTWDEFCNSLKDS